MNTVCISSTRLRRLWTWRKLAFCGLGVISILIVATAVPLKAASSYALPDQNGSWEVPAENAGRLPAKPISISVQGIGQFEVDPQDVEQNRTDVFQPGHISVFDLLVRLDTMGELTLVYHYDEQMATHVIDSINGEANWWYSAQYAGGWYEKNITRMDLYPVKDGTKVQIIKESEFRIEKTYETFQAEVDQLATTDGSIIIPSVTIRGGNHRSTLEFKDVEVTAHGVRLDLFQPGVVTALDIILSLGEQGMLSEVGLTWYERIFLADPVDNYYIERISAEGFSAQASGGCGFVYELGPTRFSGFDGAHIHIPTDARVIISPEYALWFWICL